ncbi:MAG: leucyl aminopeptidase [Gemmatimonadota bacterium]|jgi:leucyl aminopeptidase
MQVRFLVSEALQHDTPLMALAVPEGITEPSGLLADVDDATGGAVLRALESGDLKGRTKDEVVLYASSQGPERFALLGTGEPGRFDTEQVRRFAARAVRVAERLGLERLSLWLPGSDGPGGRELGQAAAEGATLAAWRFTELKNTESGEGPRTDVGEIDVLSDSEDVGEGVHVGYVIAEAENLARTLQSRPGNRATPSLLAEEAHRIGTEHGLAVTVFDEARLRAEGMHAILAVSQGSKEEARLIVLEHAGGNEGDPPLVLVGKGLTFDAGGISLKPPSGMEDMKFDMSGGAAVLGAMQAIAKLRLQANVVGIVPSSENLPSGTAVKPGDVIDTLAGKTVEVINTDAEGRLILADALAYGARRNPAAMVDCATLTGAVVIGLGHHAAGVLGNDEELIQELRDAGERSGERCWPLPLWDDYKKQLESDTADLKNVGGRPAGTITAACFLSEFVGETPWAHLDVAGTAYGEGKQPYLRKGGHGFPTRLLVAWVRGRAS